MVCCAVDTKVQDIKKPFLLPRESNESAHVFAGQGRDAPPSSIYRVTKVSPFFCNITSVFRCCEGYMYSTDAILPEEGMKSCTRRLAPALIE